MNHAFCDRVCQSVMKSTQPTTLAKLVVGIATDSQSLKTLAILIIYVLILLATAILTLRRLN
ncbi:hypothetical protein [Nostoc sp. PCC 9305]|uniref:hypothetical protein n=1 Tax=Nostoc sp. PCC 9305 TaxID=296636 RepID=UPI0039C5F5D9